MQSVERVRELLAEAVAELTRYDGLRNNTVRIIEDYKQRLRLFGVDDVSLTLPGVGGRETNEMKPDRPKFTGVKTALYGAILDETLQAMDARQVWAAAERRGARSDSTNPSRAVFTTLKWMAKQGRIDQVGPGLFASKKRRETRVAS